MAELTCFFALNGEGWGFVATTLPHLEKFVLLNEMEKLRGNGFVFDLLLLVAVSATLLAFRQSTQLGTGNFYNFFCLLL